MTTNAENGESLLARLMCRPPLRFGTALFLGGIIALVTILLMRTLIDEYDEAASDAIVRIFKLKTVSIADNDHKALAYGEHSDAGRSKTNSPAEANAASTDKTADELQEILRKKREMISILEEG